MTQERLLKLAKLGLHTKLGKEYEIQDRIKARTGRPSKIQKDKINSLWNELDEIEEMLIKLEEE